MAESTRVSDVVVAVALQTVEPPPPPELPPVPPVPPPSPTRAAADATVEQTGADPPPGCDPRSLDARLRSLFVNQGVLAARLTRLEDWVDVVSSPLYKRVWFVLTGWRWARLGRWRGPDVTGWPRRPGE